MSILNRSYARDKGRCWGPIYFAGEPYNFYINAPVSDPNHASFRLDLVRMLPNGTVQTQAQNIADGGIVIKFIDSINYNILANFIIPVNTPIGPYKLGIWDASAGIYKALSNDVIVEDAAIVENTALLSYRNEDNIYGFDYEGNPDWYNKVRYPLIHTGFTIEKEQAQYRNVHNRKLRNLKGFKDEVYTIQSYKFPEEGHRAIAAIYDHSTIFLNTTAITPKTPYTIENNIRTVLTNGSVDVIANAETEIPEAIVAQVRQFSDEWSEEFA